MTSLPLMIELVLACLSIVFGWITADMSMDDPFFKNVPKTVSVDSGDTAVLYCAVQGLGDRTIVWRKVPDPSPLTVGTTTWVKDSRFHVEHVPNSEQWNLIIQDVRPTDSGTYECQISLRHQQLRQNVILKVKDSSLQVHPHIQISGESYIRAGNPIRLTCNASIDDDTLDSIEWLKDGSVLNAAAYPRHKIFTSVTVGAHASGTISSVLDISGATPEDSGTYLCRLTERMQLAGVSVKVHNDSQNMKRADMVQVQRGIQLTAAAGRDTTWNWPFVYVLASSLLASLLLQLLLAT